LYCHQSRCRKVFHRWSYGWHSLPHFGQVNVVPLG
jgi:hypothetical protein